MPDIYVGLVHHKHGLNVYAAMTAQGVTAQVANYCREWWSDLAESDDLPATVPETDNKVVSDYFEAQSEILDGEIFEIVTTELHTEP
jgi:hypothetical protein